MVRVKKPIQFTQKSCRRLLKHISPSQLSHTNRNKNNVLMYACRNGMLDICKAILSYPNDCGMDQINTHGDTALSLAYKNGSYNIVMEILMCGIECGLGRTYDSLDGNTILMSIYKNPKSHLFNILINGILSHKTSCGLDKVNREGDTTLSLAYEEYIKNPNDYIIKKILSLSTFGLDKLYPQLGHNTILMCIIKSESYNLFDTIYPYSELCGIDTVNKEGDTALSLAYVHNRNIIAQKILSLLVECGLNKVYASLGNKTILMKAVHNGRAELYNKILSHPTDIALGYNDKNNNTVLMYAISSNILTLINKILNMNVDCGLDYVNETNGNTALLLACGNKLSSVVMKILSHPTDCKLNHANKIKVTALLYACNYSMTDWCMKMLEISRTTS